MLLSLLLDRAWQVAPETEQDTSGLLSLREWSLCRPERSYTGRGILAVRGFCVYASRECGAELLLDKIDTNQGEQAPRDVRWKGMGIRGPGVGIYNAS